MPKTLFIDSTPDIDRLWKRVHGPGDIAIAVNTGPVAEGDIPKLLQGYDTVIDDATVTVVENATTPGPAITRWSKLPPKKTVEVDAAGVTKVTVDLGSATAPAAIQSPATVMAAPVEPSTAPVSTVTPPVMMNAVPAEVDRLSPSGLDTRREPKLPLIAVQVCGDSCPVAVIHDPEAAVTPPAPENGP